jgi:hypothetical protein
MGSRIISQAAWLSLLLCVAQFSSAVQVTGATGGINSSTGERPSRQEISTFSQSGAAWNVFILSLFELQRDSESDPMSYFRIAGMSLTLAGYTRH